MLVHRHGVRKCKCVLVCACMDTDEYVCMRMSACMYVFMYVRVYTDVCVCMHVCKYACMYVSMHACM